MIPSHSLAALRTASLPALVMEYLPLRQAGQRWQARCPFHREKTASFTVWPDHYHCFGCGAGGSTIDFLMRIEHLPFPEAAKRLADRIGVTLDDKPLTRRQSILASQDAEFCHWWWKQREACLVAGVHDALEGPCVDDEWAETQGNILRHFRALPVTERFAVFRREATARDRVAWEADVAYEREFKGWWLGRAG